MNKLIKCKVKQCYIFILTIVGMLIYSPLMAADNMQKKEAHMLLVRKAVERGFSERSWLKSAFTFSFSDYYDPKYMGFRSLRVINEDFIKGGAGFDSHPHNDMEIITYVIKGALQHKDSMGNTSIIRPGEVQRMTAGTGIVHSEYNYEKDSDTHLYQIWITPSKKDSKPSYAQKSFENELKNNKLVLVISKNAREGSIAIDQDADLYLSRLSKGESISFDVQPGRYVWLQMVKGKMKVNNEELSAGDGLNTSGKAITLNFSALEDGEFMLFDLS
jgi:redox-sensitive bicupin YhaK (pirin superfamily)